MILVAVEDSASHKGPSLPVDFPPHLLLKICDSILAPLLSESSPLKPYTRPWSRSIPAPWHGARSATAAGKPSEVYEMMKFIMCYRRLGEREINGIIH